MRQIVLDTETTGLLPVQGHRIIEIGCVELINRRHTGRRFHQYINPERDIEAAASAVHGLSRERLSAAPRFGEIAASLLEFIAGSELIIHNAEFDVAFLDMELALLAAGTAAAARVTTVTAVTPVTAGAAGTDGAPASARTANAWPASVRNVCSVLDTLALARQRHPGQRNNLDALCKRYDIDNSRRELHGALLDAQLLADVYLAMTGGQSLLALEDAAREAVVVACTAVGVAGNSALVRPAEPLRVIEPSAEELAAHAEFTALLQKLSGGKCLWLQALPAAEESLA